MARKAAFGVCIVGSGRCFTQGSQADLDLLLKFKIFYETCCIKYGCSELSRIDDWFAAILRHVGAGPQYGRFLASIVATGFCAGRVRANCFDRHFKSAFGYFSAIVAYLLCGEWCTECRNGPHARKWRQAHAEKKADGVIIVPSRR